MKKDLHPVPPEFENLLASPSVAQAEIDQLVSTAELMIPYFERFDMGLAKECAGSLIEYFKKFTAAEPEALIYAKNVLRVCSATLAEEEAEAMWLRKCSSKTH